MVGPNKHTHACEQCTHTGVGLTQVCFNKFFIPRLCLENWEKDLVTMAKILVIVESVCLFWDRQITLVHYQSLSSWPCEMCVLNSWSVSYFECLTTFEALYHWTFIVGGAHTHFMKILLIYESIWSMYEPRPYVKFSDIQHFKHGNVLEIHNRIFDFCPGLPHTVLPSSSPSLCSLFRGVS